MPLSRDAVNDVQMLNVDGTSERASEMFVCLQMQMMMIMLRGGERGDDMRCDNEVRWAGQGRILARRGF